MADFDRTVLVVGVAVAIIVLSAALFVANLDPTVVAAAVAGFFVVLSVVLLARYRSVSQQITSSSDLGHDLWEALEARMKRQDERILDMMSRVDVIQARLIAAPSIVAAGFSRPAPRESVVSIVPRPAPVRAPASSGLAVEPIELEVIKTLGAGPQTSVEIRQLIRRSREHTARLLKGLFEKGFVIRDDSKKPFVYELTEAGRNYLSTG